MFHGGGAFEEVGAGGVGGFGRAEVFEDNDGIEVRRFDGEDFEMFFAEAAESSSGEIVDVLGEDVAVARAENSGGEGAEVWDEDETVAAGAQDFCGFFEEGARVDEVFDNGPKCDGAEWFRKIEVEEIAAADGDALSLRVIEGGAGDVGAGDVVSGFELVEECAGGAADVEDAALFAMAFEEAEFALESDRGVIALEFFG